MAIRSITVLTLSLLLTACSGGFGTMDGIMSSWQGAHIDDVIAQWGYPHAERTIAGRKVYVWYKNETMTMPSTSSSTVNVIGNTAYVNTQTYGGGEAALACTRTLEVNEANIVVKWQWEGNNCPFAEAFGYADWRRKGAAAAEKK